jgi:hypothetical protein
MFQGRAWRLPLASLMLVASSTKASALGVQTYLGLGASQLTLKSTTTKDVSDGFLGLIVGAGASYNVIPALDAEMDVMYAQRKIQLFDTKASFPVIQIPLLAKYKFQSLYLGGGGYYALWNQKGQMVQGGTTTAVSASDLGLQSTEYGLVLNVGSKFEAKGIPLRADFRWNKSLSELSSSSAINGSLVEYQLLLAYDFGGGK